MVIKKGPKVKTEEEGSTFSEGSIIEKYKMALLVITLFYLVLTPILASVWVKDMPSDYEKNGLSSTDLSEAVFEHYGVPSLILVFVLVASIVGGMYLAKDELRTRRWGR